MKSTCMEIEKRIKQLEKINKKGKVLTKFTGEGGKETKLDPYKRKKFDSRDLLDLEGEDDENISHE